MTLGKFVILLLLGIIFVILLAIVAYQPRRMLKRVGAYLREAMRDPKGAGAAIPADLLPIATELAGVRAQILEREAEVQRSESRRRELTAFLAHDLKTPLTSVLGYLELLRDEPGLTVEERAKYIGIAFSKAKRLEELVSEFFDINTMDLELKATARIDLSLLLEQIIDEFYPLFAPKGLRAVTNIAPELTVLGDGDRLARVFDNILKNAVSYSTPDSAVELTATRAGSVARVTVTNDGLEIPESELAHIFEKFYRLDSARNTHTGGAGLGLAIAKEIVELHGGEISAECNGTRTSFHITLPLLTDNKA